MSLSLIFWESHDIVYLCTWWYPISLICFLHLFPFFTFQCFWLTSNDLCLSSWTFFFCMINCAVEDLCWIFHSTIAFFSLRSSAWFILIAFNLFTKLLILFLHCFFLFRLVVSFCFPLVISSWSDSLRLIETWICGCTVE